MNETAAVLQLVFSIVVIIIGSWLVGEVLNLRREVVRLKGQADRADLAIAAAEQPAHFVKDAP